MKRLIWLFGLCLLVMSANVSAQTTLTATFTYGPLYGSPGTTCSNILSWNGVPNAYPEDMGAVCTGQADPDSGPEPYYSFLGVPWQLGFQSLGACNITWGARTYARGDGTHTGDTFNWPATSSNCYNAPNVTFTTIGSYTVTMHTSCYRGHCITYAINTLQGGSGFVTEQ